MVDLTRTVRFCLNGPGLAPAPGAPFGSDCVPQPPRVHNGSSAWPPMVGLGRYYEIQVKCTGQPNPVTGYLINIKDIDQAVHQQAVAYLEQWLDSTHAPAATPMGQLMVNLTQRLKQSLQTPLVEMRFSLTPYFSLTTRSHDMDHVLITQHYEFAAAHRLHVASVDDEQNRQLFGKCNNPSGHGHNYQVKIAVRAPIDPDGHIIPVSKLDTLIDQTVIQELDHKHLNRDVPAFTDLNPSVENIAMVIYGMLAKPVTGLGVELDEVSVWETSRTSCTYRGPAKPVTA